MRDDRLTLAWIGLTCILLLTSACAKPAPTPTSLTEQPTAQSPKLVSTDPVQEAFNSKLNEINKLNPELTLELKNLPDFKNLQLKHVEALERITNLLASATNPEVREAFDLMIKGGTPYPKDHKYIVPSYNTELQVLYWLAEQNEFKQDDTLALAIAMVNGFWVTLGDNEVRKAVYKDSNDLLNFLRETNEIQKARGYYQLEDYPLEAKVYLSWRGNDLGRGGHIHYELMSGGFRQNNPVNIHIFYNNREKKVNLSDYQWNNVSINTLTKMREYVDKSGWLKIDQDATVGNIERYFYFDPKKWIFTEPNDNWLNYKGEKTVNHNMNNANLEFEYLQENGKGIGVCDDEMTLVDALLKSWGIASGAMVRTYSSNHTHIFYYEPRSKTWKCYIRQISIGTASSCNIYLFEPPIIQHNYYISYQDSNQWFMKMLNMYHKIVGASGPEIKDLFITGVPTSKMKQWVFYE